MRKVSQMRLEGQCLHEFQGCIHLPCSNPFCNFENHEGRKDRLRVASMLKQKAELENIFSKKDTSEMEGMSGILKVGKLNQTILIVLHTNWFLVSYKNP